MTIEITRNLKYVYRIHERDPLVIERRLNKPYCHWYWYARRDTPQEAKRALLAMQEDDGKEPTP